MSSGEVISTGGRSSINVTSASALVLFPDGDEWIPVASMSTPRSGHALAELSAKRVLACGGAITAFQTTTVFDSCEIYSFSTNTWSPTAPMTHRRTGAALIALDGGKKALVFGGFNGTTALAKAEIYDSETDKWTEVADMNVARSSMLYFKLLDGRILTLGGTSQASNTAEIYSPVMDSWVLTPNLLTERRAPSGVLLGDGRVLVVGGDVTAATTVAINAVEVFNPSTQTWTAIEPLREARVRHSVTTMKNGAILVTGGHSGGNCVNCGKASTEVLTTIFGSWTAGPEMTGTRLGHQALRLGDGRILVTGGGPSIISGSTPTTELLRGVSP